MRAEQSIRADRHGARSLKRCTVLDFGDSRVFQNNPAIKRVVEEQLRLELASEGKDIREICMLIHTKSGLLSESPRCDDRDYVLEMARKIVSSHRSKESEAQSSEPIHENMYQWIVEYRGERVAQISRQIWELCALSGKVDLDLLVGHACWILSPYNGADSDAQANIEIGFPGVRLKED